jgi:hypothetical protein
MANSLTELQINQFIQEGIVRIENAFSVEVAHEIVNILWNDLPCDRNNPATWTEPVIRLCMYTLDPFVASVNTPKLIQAYDALVGVVNWIPCKSVGTFPVRFPSTIQPKDTGKHVDASFPGNDPANYFEWRVNIKSKGRALLMLILYSDVSELDAPTVIYKGSHQDVARLLAPYGNAGLSFMELANQLDKLPEREVAYATGKAGTVYLCHPFLVHAAQPHTGHNPKFMAQPPLMLRGEFDITRSDSCSPVEQAIRLALS